MEKENTAPWGFGPFLFQCSAIQAVITTKSSSMNIFLQSRVKSHRLVTVNSIVYELKSNRKKIPWANFVPTAVLPEITLKVYKTLWLLVFTKDNHNVLYTTYYPIS